MPIFGGVLWEDKEGTQRHGGTCDGRTPPQANRDLGAGRGQHRGGAHRHRNGDSHRHMAWGAGTSGGGWRVAGAGKSQVFGTSHQEWRGGAGEKRVILRGTAADGEAVGKRGGDENDNEIL